MAVDGRITATVSVMSIKSTSTLLSHGFALCGMPSATEFDYCGPRYSVQRVLDSGIYRHLGTNTISSISTKFAIHWLQSLEHDHSLKWSQLVAETQRLSRSGLSPRFVGSRRSHSISDCCFEAASMTVVAYDWGTQDDTKLETITDIPVVFFSTDIWTRGRLIWLPAQAAVLLNSVV
jgi:hypothetical protein